MTGTSCPVLEDSTVPPVLPVEVTLVLRTTEQVTAVHDVLCLSHNLIYPKSNRSEKWAGVATQPLLLYPAYFVAYHPRVPLCIV